MKPLISLVIPVYNVEEYFPKCMETVLAQTYENFEVILVDDGSTDGSGDLCDKYESQDARVKVFHKANGGLSDARNFGIQHANGRYISIFDSDDYVTKDYLAYLYELMEEYNVDVSCAESMMAYDLKTIPPVVEKPKEELLDTEEALKKICYTHVGADTRLYKREILIKHPYPEGRLSEDLATTCKIIGDCKKIVFSDKVLSFWVQRRGSITHSKIDERQYDEFWAADEQLNYIINNYPGAVVAAKARYAMETVAFLTRLFAYNDEKSRWHFERARGYFKPHIRTVLLDKNVPFKIKICCISILMGYFPSRILWDIKAVRNKYLGKTIINNG